MGFMKEFPTNFHNFWIIKRRIEDGKSGNPLVKWMKVNDNYPLVMTNSSPWYR